MEIFPCLQTYVQSPYMLRSASTNSSFQIWKSGALILLSSSGQADLPPGGGSTIWLPPKNLPPAHEMMAPLRVMKRNSQQDREESGTRGKSPDRVFSFELSTDLEAAERHVRTSTLATGSRWREGGRGDGTVPAAGHRARFGYYYAGVLWKAAPAARSVRSRARAPPSFARGMSPPLPRPWEADRDHARPAT